MAQHAAKKDIQRSKGSAGLTPAKIIGSFVLGVFALGFVVVYRAMALPSESLKDIVKNMLSVPFSSPGMFALTLAVFVVVTAASLACFAWPKKTSGFVYRFRWLIALCVLAILVIADVSGSSIGAWAGTLPNSENTGLLFGTERGTRTDEWALFTSMTVSQFADSGNLLPYYNDALRGTMTDMYILYGQPVANWAIIFKPFQIGYLFLGLDRGLSFFWYARLIFLFMFTFECGMLLTRKSKPLSIALAFLVAFGPGIQWWFSINSFVEMIVFAEAIVLLVWYYLGTSSYGKRALCAIGVGYCLCGYALSLYPAWQVPLAYVLLIGLIAVFIARGKSAHLRLLRDGSLALVAIVIFAVGIAGVYLQSHEAISSILNTAYPGNRTSTGGDSAGMLFLYPQSLFLPYTTSNLGHNPDDGTAFFDLFPLGLLLTCWVLFKQRKRDPFLIGLLVVGVVFLLYEFVGFPEWLATISLLGKSISARVATIESLVNVLMLIRALTLIEEVSNRKVVLVVSACCAAFMVAMCWVFSSSYMDAVKIVVAFCVIALLMYAAMRNHKIFAIGCSLCAVVCGATVNPIQLGTDFIEETPLISDIEEIDAEQEGVWVCEADWASNIPLLAGVSTLNSTNIYPNLDFWHSLDPDGSDEYIYNRYAHIKLTVTDEETTYSLDQVDVISLNLNYRDLEKAGVTYVLANLGLPTAADLTTFNDDYVTFEDLTSYGQWHVYRVVYAS